MYFFESKKLIATETQKNCSIFLGDSEWSSIYNYLKIGERLIKNNMATSIKYVLGSIES
jgi:hypothetical protein